MRRTPPLMPKLLQKWNRTGALVRAEIMAGAWECCSALLFISAVLPKAFSSPWPGVIFGAGLTLTALSARPLTRLGSRGFTIAVWLRTFAWLLSVTPILSGNDVRVLVATCGFGLMAGGIRRAIYRQLLAPLPPAPSARRLRIDFRSRVGESAMVAGIVGGHVMLLFSVAFLRTTSQMVFRAWWEIIPALAILGTAGFTLAIRPTTQRILSALELGPSGDRRQQMVALDTALRLPSRLSRVNFALWFICTTIGVLYFRLGPQNWKWADAIMQISFGALFAWGVSFYQRSWLNDLVHPVVALFRRWTGAEARRDEVSLRRRMLSEFGLPLLFALTLSLFAAIGLYRSLAADLSFQEDFNAITALCASSLMLVLAVGGVFLRAARHLSDPLTRLAGFADQVAAGKLDAHAPRVEAPREVVDLGGSIEAMRKTLARTIDELKDEQSSLESRVEARTAELSLALEELKNAQVALIQGERMASLGVLMAGMAHEVYNPLNAISGSVAALQRVSDELHEMLRAYHQTEEQLPLITRQEIAQRRADLDIDGALDDLTGVAKVVTNATHRCVDIVANLKNFSRAASEPVPFDIHEGLKETLGLLAHPLKQFDIEVSEQFHALPEVICRGGEINQVFMNLLSNAIYAVRTHHGAHGGSIEITTKAAGDEVVIMVRDNGGGVAASLREQVFDPFFTTKPRGEGTGLGLSISHEIVRRHGGSLSLAPEDPTAGSGACFICRLPVKLEQISSSPGHGPPQGAHRSTEGLPTSR